MNDARRSGQPASADGPPALDLGALTPTERRVAELALTGLSSHAIAAELVVAESTVHTHLTHVYRKLGVSTRLELLAAASRQEAAPSSVAAAPGLQRRFAWSRVALVIIGALLAAAAVAVVSLLAASPTVR